MTLFVDELMHHGWRLRGRATRNCHLFTDGDLSELHNFATEKLGMKRSWFQDASTPHYDLTERRRLIAIALGAVECSKREAVAIWRQLRERAQP